MTDSRQQGFNSASWRRRVVAARGTGPADVLLAGGKIVNVFTEELIEANVAIVDGRIAAVGNYANAAKFIDCRDKIIAPSFIDPHIHVESSMVWLPEFAKAVVPHGTGAVVTDPHEIANVAGLPGIEAVRSASSGLPLHVRFTAPSCVPASAWESPGARFGSDQIAEMLAWPETVGLGELMNVAGALSGDAMIGFKLGAAEGTRKDGHAPEVTGRRLQAYLATGVGSDHESTTLDEAYEKLRAGLMIMIRQGTSERNLDELLPLAADSTYPRVMFCSDDRDCHTLLADGHIDAILRDAIAGGLDPLRAIRLATWNAANYWGLTGIGAVAPGYEANLVVLDDLQSVAVSRTLFQGRIVAEEGVMTDSLWSAPPAHLLDSMRLAPISESDLRLDPAAAKQAVGVVPGQIVTELVTVEPTIANDDAVADVDRDLLKLVSVERHKATGRTGVGYISGFGLQRGAIASTVAHDAHNIVAVGTNDADLLCAIRYLGEHGGGLVAVTDGDVRAFLALPIGGIMSDQPLETVAQSVADLEATARSFGSRLDTPFGTLAFMSLSVIPKARVTDKGFVLVS